MYKLETVIHIHTWEATRTALEALQLTATLKEVKTFGRTPPKREVYRGSAYLLEMTPELELSLLVPEPRLEATLAALQAVVDAEIVVTTVERLVDQANSSGAPRALPRVAAMVRPISSLLHPSMSR